MGEYRMKKHVTAGILLASLLLSLCTVGCGGDTETPAVTDTASNGTETEAQTEPLWLDSLPQDLDLGGETVIIRCRGNDGNILEIAPENEIGDVLNDAVFSRNRDVEERLNVDIVLSPGEGWESYSKEITTLRASVAAGDNAWQIIAGWANSLPTLSLENCFYDLTDMQYLDLKQPWWNQSAVEGICHR